MAWNPASKIIDLLGGEASVSSITDTSYTAPYRWQAPIDKGGTGGRIPARHIPKLIEAARERNLELTADDFFAEPSEVSA